MVYCVLSSISKKGGKNNDLSICELTENNLGGGRVERTKECSQFIERCYTWEGREFLKVTIGLFTFETEFVEFLDVFTGCSDYKQLFFKTCPNGIFWFINFYALFSDQFGVATGDYSLLFRELSSELSLGMDAYYSSFSF